MSHAPPQLKEDILAKLARVPAALTAIGATAGALKTAAEVQGRTLLPLSQLKS